MVLIGFFILNHEARKDREEKICWLIWRLCSWMVGLEREEVARHIVDSAAAIHALGQDGWNPFLMWLLIVERQMKIWNFA
jgi:hypothetical protein